MFCARLFVCALWSPAGKGLTSWLSFVVSSVSLSLSHWYPGSGVALDCIDSWSLQPYYFDNVFPALKHKKANALYHQRKIKIWILIFTFTFYMINQDIIMTHLYYNYRVKQITFDKIWVNNINCQSRTNIFKSISAITQDRPVCASAKFRQSHNCFLAGSMVVEDGSDQQLSI